MRVLTYNIREGAAGRETAVLEVLQMAQADLIVLQEVLDPTNARRFADALGLALTFAPSNARTRNVALLSRYPVVVESAYHPFPLLRTLLLATVALPGGARLNLYAPHLGLIHDLWRTYEVSVVLKRTRAHESAHPTPYAMLVGDFNAVAPGDRVQWEGLPIVYALILAAQFRFSSRFALRRVLRAGYIDCYRASHPARDGFTIPTYRPGARLDYLFVSRPLADRLRCCEVFQPPPAVAASDHFPLCADFDL